jgi:hypothetical protein
VDVAVADEFLPLLAPVVASLRPPVPLCMVRVGSVVIPVASSPVVEECPVASAPSLGTQTQGSTVRDDMAACRPLVTVEVVGPALQSQQLQCGAASGLSGPSLVRSRSSSSSAQPPHPTSLLKWAWRLVGTLDPSLLIPTPFSDLARANLLHLTVLAPRISRSSLFPTMDRSRCEGRDGWEGRAGSKRSFKESLPLDERRVDSLSESEPRLLLERRERVGYHLPVRMLEAGRFEGDSSRYP